MTFLLIYPPPSSLLTSLAAYLSLKDAGSLKLFPKTAQNLFIYKKKNWRPITLLMTCNITDGSFRTTLISSSTFVLHGKYISGGQGESKWLTASAEKQIRVSVFTDLTNRTNTVKCDSEIYIHVITAPQGHQMDFNLNTPFTCHALQGSHAQHISWGIPTRWPDFAKTPLYSF